MLLQSPRLRAEFDQQDCRAERSRTAHEKIDWYTRMLFNRLMDADRLHAAGKTAALAPLGVERRFRTLIDYPNQLIAHFPEDIVKAIRVQCSKIAYKRPIRRGHYFPYRMRRAQERHWRP